MRKRTPPPPPITFRASGKQPLRRINHPLVDQITERVYAQFQRDIRIEKERSNHRK
ncbi:MAG: hypothetical protein AAGD96_08960 [Chloroflexota bacterium]